MKIIKVQNMYVLFVQENILYLSLISQMNQKITPLIIIINYNKVKKGI